LTPVRETQHVVIVGSGPAGLSTALSLRDRGRPSLVVEKAGQVAAAWRGRYDVLKLNTGRQVSHLPGRRYPKGTPLFPSRDQVIDHLERYAREDGIDLRLNTEVTRIDSVTGGWCVRTSGGDLQAQHVIVATGNQHTPFTPKWVGSELFTGAVLHSSEYRNPGPYAGKRVLIIGSGSSGMEIAHDLATGGAATTWLAVRTPPNIMLRSGPAGLPGDVIANPLYHAPPRLADAISRAARRRAIGDLTEFGLPVPEEGPFSRLRRLSAVPSLVDLEVIDAIRDGSIAVVPTVEAFERDAVRLVDGQRVDPDVVICATGYRRGLEPMVGHVGVLDQAGKPGAQGARPAADGLWFIGYMSRPSLIGTVAKQSRRLAKQIA
jgi:cation diffusion facilitator CzcD-associated flavoprotein CzcO